MSIAVAHLKSFPTHPGISLDALFDLRAGQERHHAAGDIQAAVESANHTRQEIGRLVSSNSDIGGEIKVIEAIARQTRLLALNASIDGETQFAAKTVRGLAAELSSLVPTSKFNRKRDGRKVAPPVLPYKRS